MPPTATCATPPHPTPPHPTSIEASDGVGEVEWGGVEWCGGGVEFQPVGRPQAHELFGWLTDSLADRTDNAHCGQKLKFLK